jgi:tyrosyl-DNA phosphodiesterase 2
VTFRRRAVPVTRFDTATGAWTAVDAAGAANRDHLTLTTFNIWFDDYHADVRYRAICDRLRDLTADVMVFQEVTPAAVEVFCAQPWIRADYLAAHVTGGRAGNYGMLLLSRLPLDRVTYRRLPTRMSRGLLRADLTVGGEALAVGSVHLDSGKRSVRLRGRQLRTVYRTFGGAADAVLLGDFNMRDAENGRIRAPYLDVWPALRPDEPGFTEDTSINLMRLASKNKHRHVRFDRVLVKGGRWAPAAIGLLGTEPVSAALPRVFPSDHFGLCCRLVRRPVAAPAASRSPARFGWWARLRGLS